MTDKNNLSYWFPVIKRAGLPMPETEIVTTRCDLSPILDGEIPDGFEVFLAHLKQAADSIGYPCFLRTGHGSGKHDWINTCHVTSPFDLVSHVGRLVEWSHTVDLLGLPTDTWVVRRMIPTKPLFVAFWGHMPITREFRLFVRDGVVETWQPYWPAAALEGHVHDCPDWRERLRHASLLRLDEYKQLEPLTIKAGRALGGYWSVDWLQDAYGGWWCTDLALGDESFRYDPATGESNQKPSFVKPDYSSLLNGGSE